MSNGFSSGLLADLTRLRDARCGRASSWDHSGRNQDHWIVPAGESRVLADLEGPGCITHIWMTQWCRRVLGPGLIDPAESRGTVPMFEIHNALGLNWEVRDPDYYRKVLLKMYWDDQEHPSVLVPLGDFFCLGHSIASNFASLPFTSSVKEEDQHEFGGGAGLNCYFKMPFNKRARIEVENQNDVPYGQYFYIDYELYREPLPNDTAYFHARWRRENPCDGWGPEIQANSPEANIPNLDGRGNYVILEAEGRGHYVGCNLSVTHFQGTWWGEGDDMIFIDGEEWPPSMHGTGSEDYFSQAWGMQKNSYPMAGSVLQESEVPGYQVSYRFHLTDPVRFSKSIRVTMEHGHANHLADEWSSTAYWYQTLPSKPFDILPMEQRLPLRGVVQPGVPQLPRPVGERELTEEQRGRLRERQERYERYTRERDAQLSRKAEDSKERERRNAEHARRIRESFNQTAEAQESS